MARGEGPRLRASHSILVIAPLDVYAFVIVFSSNVAVVPVVDSLALSFFFSSCTSERKSSKTIAFQRQHRNLIISLGCKDLGDCIDIGLAASRVSVAAWCWRERRREQLAELELRLQRKRNCRICSLFVPLPIICI